ncbi:MAG: filamentous hemagglutinin N-terminal domain-containing protein [Symploca sp. SIO1C2]|nr:filamentous hemagglutinin N-terminal domain-containing protein [Symploca sp. SIO1C2]NER49249.1 filamentous hemagglutinin N-terminal domain-containing protein [Symploca sp. SIO1A3]
MPPAYCLGSPETQRKDAAVGFHFALPNLLLSCCATLILLIIFGIKTLRAQPITAAADGTATQVTSASSNPNQFDISGGTHSGANLFHSFEQFHLNPNQIANFLTLPNIQNILGRVVSGDASFIDGFIQVTGGNSNLYLMNPAGIIFGQKATLNVPASFVATTANGIQIGDDWFSATGNQNYGALVGSPKGLAFSNSQPGSIINAGNLTTPAGEMITLVGGIVVNTGTLATPSGEITIAAVPGEKFVRLSQAGTILSFDLPVATQAELNANSPPLTPLSLQQLITQDIGSATEMMVEDGVVTLTGSGMTIPGESGTAVVSGTVDVAHQTLPTAGTIRILGDQVRVSRANINASGQQAGGTVLIGGDYQGQGILPNASSTYVSSDSEITADALQTGDGGRVIVWGDKLTAFYGEISARGGSSAGNGGFVEVSGKSDLIFRGTVDLSATNGSTGNLLLDPTNITIVDGNGVADDVQVTGDNQIRLGDNPGATFTISETALENLAGNANVTLQATNNITINDLTDNSLTFAAGTGEIQFTAGGNFLMNPGDTIASQGRKLTIAAASITAGEISTFDGASVFDGDDLRLPDVSGDVHLTATSGDINVERIFGKDIIIESINGNIRTGSISSEAANFGPGSHASLTARNGTITLNGRIRAGITNKTSDSTITIEAARFIATVPREIIEADTQGNRVADNGAIQTVTTSLYAYPGNVDPLDNPPRVGTGQILIQFANQPPTVQGTGETLITIRILQDTSFTIGTFDGTGSGTEGIIGIGAERAPSVIPLLEDNQFSAIDDAVTATGQILELEQNNARGITCDSSSTDENDDCGSLSEEDDVLEVISDSSESLQN